MDITKEEFMEWKENPTTKKIFEEVKSLRDQLMEELSTGRTLGHQADITHGLTSEMVGNIKGLNQLLNIDFNE